MKVDIIMPTYSPNLSILEAIDSCLSQSYPAKLTVIDDSSPAGIDWIKKKYPQVNFLKTPKNMGPAGARNWGIQRTKGDLISFLDDDDIMMKNKILWSVDAFKASPGIGMTCGNYRILVNRKNLRPPFYKKKIHIDWQKLMKRNYVASGSVTVSRKTLEKVGLFDVRFWIGEDAELWLRISEEFPIKYLHQVLYHYSVMPGSNSLTQRADIQKKHLDNLRTMQAESRGRMNAKIKFAEPLKEADRKS